MGDYEMVVNLATTLIVKGSTVQPLSEENARLIRGTASNEPVILIGLVGEMAAFPGLRTEGSIMVDTRLLARLVAQANLAIEQLTADAMNRYWRELDEETAIERQERAGA